VDGKMLVAQYENQLVDMLGLNTKEQWTERMKTGRLICPVCKKRVLPKCGTKKIWHFAHASSSTCAIETESETDYHLMGKKSLFKRLEALNEHPELEYYMREIAQRPDLFLSKKKCAVEFQCATMDTKIFCQRIRGYQSLRMQSDWFFGMKRVKKTTDSLYQIKGSDFSAVKKDTNGHLYLNYFCPLRQCFLLLRHIVPITASKAAATGHILPLKNLNAFEDLFHVPALQKYPFSLWSKQKVQWRMSAFKNQLHSCLYVKKVLYNNNRSLPLFSPLAGMPTKDFFLIQTPPFIWQSYLLFIIEKTPLFFTAEQIQKDFRRLVINRIFHAREMPYIDNPIEDAVQEYLLFLQSIKIIREVGVGQYKKIFSIPYPKTMSEAIELDEIFSKKSLFFDFV
jgi:competence protein CoiA